MNNDATEEPSAERDNALAIAELKGEFCGEIEAIKARNEAMESRIDAKLTDLQAEMATSREDAAKRETRLLLSIAVMITLGVSVMSLAVALIALWSAS
ncbi:MAG: hypothetical protein OXE94_02040 [Aestuariivita sp.]|nr:hypothetical protein [Aestuariivita sp.]MCY4202169.1 hypothetical protein [Aestuariivita sp.]MCY4289605.1 hypothetical protein [Aestuariivita sp.]MCY4347448.1 hypothetical protein [Aestuariivita sp.]